MTRLDDVLAATRAEGRAALVGYLPAGFPTVDGAVEAMTAMVRGGVAVVEVGLPYSDPLMDGPTIQQAVEVALVNKTSIGDVVTTVREVAATGAPTLLMTYWNPIERHGPRRLADELAAAGCAAVITPDLTPDEAGTEPSDWLGITDATGLGRIFLVAPSSTDERLRMTAAHCRGFVYAASTMGVTGTRGEVGDTAEALVKRVRAVTDIPVCVGLGVSNGSQAAQVASFADGVIVGSAFVRALLDASTPKDGCRAVESLAAELAEGVRVGRR
ncbi:MAG: tryptophan synthase subunit alpha [Sporichthyaceae bacterium]|nr:tryptophan synthase subunit alpha [Sporichthyaceae bacterium]